METEQSWHNSKYIDKGNTCAQDTYFYCSDLYNPKMSFANLYTDYADCMIKKTPLDCGQEFLPENWSGGVNPYKEAHHQDFIDKYGEEDLNDSQDTPVKSESKITANMYLIIAIVLAGILILSPDKKNK